MQDQLSSNVDDRKLSYKTPVIVLGGGDVDVEILHEFVARGYPLIAADGAADVALAHEIPIEAIIGDLDSINDISVFSEPTQIIKIDEQETTDFEKCLYSVEAPLYVCIGMLGKRIDHTLAAFHTIARLGHKKNIVLVDQYEMSFGVGGNVEFDLPKRTRFSIYPLQPVTFKSSDGLKYPLDGLTLEVGRRIGTSNKVVKNEVVLTPLENEMAPYLVILPREHFDRVFDASV